MRARARVSSPVIHVCTLRHPRVRCYFGRCRDMCARAGITDRRRGQTRRGGVACLRPQSNQKSTQRKDFYIRWGYIDRQGKQKEKEKTLTCRRSCSRGRRPAFCPRRTFRCPSCPRGRGWSRPAPPPPRRQPPRRWLGMTPHGRGGVQSSWRMTPRRRRCVGDGGGGGGARGRLRRQPRHSGRSRRRRTSSAGRDDRWAFVRVRSAFFTPGRMGVRVRAGKCVRRCACGARCYKYAGLFANFGIKPNKADERLSLPSDYTDTC